MEKERGKQEKGKERTISETEREKRKEKQEGYNRRKGERTKSE